MLMSNKVKTTKMNQDKQELVPKLRFPEFCNAEKWKFTTVKKVFSIFQGYSFSSNDAVSSGARWIKIADVSIQKMNLNSPSYLPNEFTKNHKKFLVKKGDYVIALTR